MQILSPPPDDALLLALGPHMKTLAAGTRLYRVYSRAGKHPGRWNSMRTFGPLPTGARFDHHPPADPPSDHPDRAIAYAARTIPTCIAEVFQEPKTIDVHAQERALTVFRLKRAVTLHNLRGPWITRAGGSTAIGSGPHAITQQWSRKIHRLFPAVEGLWYGSSMNTNQPAIVLFERAEDALPTACDFDEPLSHPELKARLSRCAKRFGYLLLP